MDKAWVKGAAGEKWEAFLTHSHDEAEYGQDREQCLDDMYASGFTPWEVWKQSLPTSATHAPPPHVESPPVAATADGTTLTS